MTNQERNPTPPKDLRTVDARQGRWGRPVIWILGIGTAGAILALFGILGIYRL